MPAHEHIHPDQFSQVEAISKRAEETTGHCANCFAVSSGIEKHLGFEQAEGHYRGPEVNHKAVHAWNVHPSGTIIDATAQQWNPKGERVRVIPKGDPRSKWYRRSV